MPLICPETKLDFPSSASSSRGAELRLAAESRADLCCTPEVCQARHPPDCTRFIFPCLTLKFSQSEIQSEQVGHTHKHIHHTHISGQDCSKQCFRGLFIQGQTNSHFENINSVKAKVLIFGKLLCRADTA